MTTLILMLIVPPLLGVLTGLFTTHLRRRREPRRLQDTVAELHRWHAAWERDHPDLIAHASYAEHLPSRETQQFVDGLMTLARPYGGKKGGVDTSAVYASLIRQPDTPPYVHGCGCDSCKKRNAKATAYIRSLPKPRRPDPHPDPPCHDCIEITTLGNAGAEYICTKSPDEPSPDY